MGKNRFTFQRNRQLSYRSFRILIQIINSWLYKNSYITKDLLDFPLLDYYSNGAKQCNIMYETALYGNDIGTKFQNILRIETCQLLCANDVNCKYWTYSVTLKECRKKSSPAGFKFSNDRISGAKDCSPSHPAGMKIIIITFIFKIQILGKSLRKMLKMISNFWF